MLCLDVYLNNLLSEGFTSIDQMTGITWEDLEDIGIHKLGRLLIVSLLTIRHIHPLLTAFDCRLKAFILRHYGKYCCL